jgi:hypothetical protein
MPDFKELFTSEDFLAYQDLVIDTTVEWLYQAMFHRSGVDMETVREVADFARKVIEIPCMVFDKPGDDIGQRLKARVESHLSKIPAIVLRRELYQK